MSKRRDPEWRDKAAGELLLEHLYKSDSRGPFLIVDDPLPDVGRALVGGGHEVLRWNRRAFGGEEGRSWPPAGLFQTVLLRLPRGKEELVMNIHAAASALVPGGEILVYGAKDEGIRGSVGPLAEMFPGAGSVAVGGRCRILRGVRGVEAPGLKPTLIDWKTTVSLDHPDLPAEWISYPGLFSHGRLDDGTRLLLDALPSFPHGARILDYGCGSGVIAHVVRGRGADVVVEMLDVDAVALEAARENVPSAKAHLHDGMLPAEEGPFDAIVSNPPFHRGKSEEPGMIESMIQDSGHLLGPKGLLVFVAQRRLSLEGALRENFRKPSVLVETSIFRVWQGRGPRKQKGTK